MAEVAQARRGEGRGRAAGHRREWLTTATSGDAGESMTKTTGCGVIAAALAANASKKTAIIPVLLGNAKRPPAKAFDSSLKRLAKFEPLLLTVDNWEAGLEALIVQVAKTTGLARRPARDGRYSNGAPARPRRVQKRQRPLKDAEVRAALEPLAQWRLQWGPHSWGAGGLAQGDHQVVQFHVLRSSRRLHVGGVHGHRRVEAATSPAVGESVEGGERLFHDLGCRLSGHETRHQGGRELRQAGRQMASLAWQDVAR